MNQFPSDRARGLQMATGTGANTSPSIRPFSTAKHVFVAREFPLLLSWRTWQMGCQPREILKGYPTLTPASIQAAWRMPPT